MELQAEAARRKRAQVLGSPLFELGRMAGCCPCAEHSAAHGRQILESEGAKESVINHAEGEKAEVILHSEAARTDAVNRATGARSQAAVVPIHCCTSMQGAQACMLQAQAKQRRSTGARMRLQRAWTWSRRR